MALTATTKPIAEKGDAVPARGAVAISPHATNPISPVPRALWVGTGGNITMRGVGDDTDTVWKNVGSGQIVPFRAQYIRVSGTTAADIVGLY